MKSLEVAKFMTPTPHSINSGMPLKTAREMMRKYGIRHLPVQLAGHLVGVLTDRDLKLGLSLDTEGTLMVEDVMTPDPFTVKPESSLAKVVESMAAKKLGSAIVQSADGKVIGIFTATDALKAFAKTLSPKPLKRKVIPKKKERKNETIRSLD